MENCAFTLFSVYTQREVHKIKQQSQKPNRYLRYTDTCTKYRVQVNEFLHYADIQFTVYTQTKAKFLADVHIEHYNTKCTLTLSIKLGGRVVCFSDCCNIHRKKHIHYYSKHTSIFVQYVNYHTGRCLYVQQKLHGHLLALV